MRQESVLLATTNKPVPEYAQHSLPLVSLGQVPFVYQDLTHLSALWGSLFQPPSLLQPSPLLTYPLTPCTYGLYNTCHLV